MFLDFCRDRVVQVDIREYVKETYEMFPEDLGRKVTSPAAEHLTNIDDTTTKLDGKRKEKK